MQQNDHPWMPDHSREYIDSLETHYASCTTDELDQHLHVLVAENRAIHERESLNLNPATNVMNPRAEALLASGLGARPS